jgi:hypothetical protein
MGLVDKVLETFNDWVNLQVEKYADNSTEEALKEYFDTKYRAEAATEAHKAAKRSAGLNPLDQQLKLLEKVSDDARKKAKKADSKAKEVYRELIHKHNAKKTSLIQKFELIFRANGIKREHYHGGKFNGVNCIRIMENADCLFHAFEKECIKEKRSCITEDAVAQQCKSFAKLLGILDAIWSSVRGIDAGLLPTTQQIHTLEKTLAKGKTMWTTLGLSTKQPKWHLTFDGHLLEQVKKFGGLADKSDESIEKFHQVLKTLRDRFGKTSSYEQRERCIRRELRRMKSPEIEKHIETYHKEKKQSSGTKRATVVQERVSDKKRIKTERRESNVATPI